MGEIADEHQSYICEEMMDMEASGNLFDFHYSRRVQQERQDQTLRNERELRSARLSFIPDGPPDF